MTTAPDARNGPTSAQATVQTVLLIVVTIVGAWLGVYRVPWRVSGDPCLMAAAATVVLTIVLWITRWQAWRGARFERNLLTGFLVGMAVVYVARYLFVAGIVASSWLWIEVLSVPIFAALAMLGVRRSPWFLATGIALHGLAWDSWHYRKSTYMPDWYTFACLAIDLALGVYVAARIPAYRSVR